MPDPIPLDFVESELPPGLSVIEASAGTGKTYAISHLVPRLLLDETVNSLGEILLVTFTNDAARELSNRVRRVLEKLAAPPQPEEPESEPGVNQLRNKFNTTAHHDIIQKALIDIDKLNVSTIHSFCQRTIQAEGALCGLPVMPEVITNADEFIEEALYDLWQDKITSDTLLASLASEKEWDIHGDVDFVKRAIPVEEFQPVPAAQPFYETLERIRNVPTEFTQKIRDELAGFIKGVGGWNNAGGDDASREAHLESLATAKNFAAPGFWKAINWVSKLPGHVTKKGAAGKASVEQAAGLTSVALAQEISGLLARLQWDWQNECVKSVRETVKAALQAKRQITQDGLILTLRDALRSPKKAALAERLRARYKVALIDESQDTDPKQFEIFKNVFIGFDGETSLADHRLVLIGDPKQAIYGFRGADVNTYLEAKNRASKKFFLTTTYRSPQPLVTAINAFFSHPDSFLKRDLEFLPATSGKKDDTQLAVGGQACEGRVEAWIVSEAIAEEYRTSNARRDCIISTVASEIVHLLKHGSLLVDANKTSPIEPGDFAVLTNSNAEAVAVAAALKDRGVPAIVASGADVMGTEEARELLCILRAVNDPRRSGLRYAALATRLLGNDAARIHDIRSDSTKDDEILRRFYQWQTEWGRMGIAAVIALIDAEEGITSRIGSSAQGERRVTNLRQLIDLLQAASREYSNRPEHLLRWFSQEIARAGEMVAADERQIQLESDRDAVQVVTMHKAKGLEYNFVFAPFLWSMHDPKGIKMLAKTHDFPNDRLVNVELSKNDGLMQTVLKRTELEDRLRLAYVAMTRAKVRLWIYGGEMGPKNGKGAKPASPLDWLLRDLTVEVITAEQFDGWSESLKNSSRGGRLAAGIQALIEQTADGCILQKAPPDTTIERWAPNAPEEECSLKALDMPEIKGVWSITSFSSLTREQNPHGTKDPAPFLTQQSEAPSGVMVRNPFLDAPGGMLVGTAIHDWLQQWDCDEPEAESVSAHLKKYRLRGIPGNSTIPLDESVVQMLMHLREAKLPGLNCTLAQACSSHEASEWHFHLPIKSNLTVQELAAAFSAHAGPDYKAYAPMLEHLTFPDLHGFLQGFMDRLAFYGDAWGVIDWKTNQLGKHPDAYSINSMMDCAMESHYLLQTHLYLVALRRYLKRVAPGSRLAGAWLVFLRGVHSGSSEGILHINPTRELLDALDDLFFEGK